MAVAQALLAAGADVTLKCHDDESALNRAVEQEHVDIAQVIIEHGVEHGMDVNAEGSAEGRTPLHVAARFNIADVVDVLIEAGANIDRENDFGNTPLHTALDKSSFATALVLLKHGASVSRQNELGDSPLHYAAATAGPPGTTKIIQLLLSKGAERKSHQQ